MKCNTFKMGHMNKKNVKKIQWDEKVVKNFEGFLKQMYGEYGKIKVD